MYKREKKQAILYAFIILILSVVLFSCSSTEPNVSNTQKMKVMEVYQSDLRYYVLDSTVYVVDVDTMYMRGDIINRNGKSLRIVDK